MVLPEPRVQELFRRAAGAGGPYQLTVDLVGRVVRDDGGFEAAFEIDDYRREMLLQGLDEIGQTLRNEGAIAAYEQRRDATTAGVSA